MNLNGGASYLITLAVASPTESFGQKFDFRNNRQVTQAIALCAVLVFIVIIGAMSAACFIWHLPVLPN